MLVDKSRNRTDVPHDYIELPQAGKTRYLKLKDVHTPTGKFALSGPRVFGSAGIPKPAAVREFVVLRTAQDKRSAWLRWAPSGDTYAYSIRMDTTPDKPYHSILVHDQNDDYFKGMDKDRPCYFTIEAVNESGIGPAGPVQTAP